MTHPTDLQEEIERLSEEENAAWIAEYDAGTNGPNQTNCHFSLFSRPELTKAWEAGYELARRAVVWAAY